MKQESNPNQKWGLGIWGAIAAFLLAFVVLCVIWAGRAPVEKGWLLYPGLTHRVAKRLWPAAVTPAAPVLGSEQVFQTQDRAELIGKKALLRGVTVQHVWGRQAFTIWSGRGEALEVQVPETLASRMNAQGQELHAGDLVTVEGMLIRSRPDQRLKSREDAGTSLKSPVVLWAELVATMRQMSGQAP